MRKFTVQADRETGEWLSDPVLTTIVDRHTWRKMVDTDDLHFDTFERFRPDGSSETCAVEVVWTD